MVYRPFCHYHIDDDQSARKNGKVLNEECKPVSYYDGIATSRLRGSIGNRSDTHILCLGCSFTEGHRVESESTWAKVTQALLRKHYDRDDLTCVNAGAGGFGLGHMYHYMTFLLATFLTPPLVVLQLPQLQRCTLPSESFLTFNAIPLPREIDDPVAQQHNTQDPNHMIAIAESYLDKILDFLRPRQIPLLIWTPFYTGVIGQKFLSERAAQKEGCTVLDNAPLDVRMLSRPYEKIVFKAGQDDHPKRQYYEWVAKEIASIICKKNLIGGDLK